MIVNDFVNLNRTDAFKLDGLKSRFLGIYTHFKVVRSYNINCALGVLHSILDWSLICDYWDFIIEGNKKSDHVEWYGFDLRTLWTPRSWSQPPNFDFDYISEHTIPLRSLAHSKSSLKICRTFFTIKSIESRYNLKGQVQSKSIESQCNLCTIRSKICEYSSFLRKYKVFQLPNKNWSQKYSTELNLLATNSWS